MKNLFFARPVLQTLSSISLVLHTMNHKMSWILFSSIPSECKKRPHSRKCVLFLFSSLLLRIGAFSMKFSGLLLRVFVSTKYQQKIGKSINVDSRCISSCYFFFIPSEMMTSSFESSNFFVNSCLIQASKPDYYQTYSCSC